MKLAKILTFIVPMIYLMATTVFAVESSPTGEIIDSDEAVDAVIPNIEEEEENTQQQDIQESTNVMEENEDGDGNIPTEAFPQESDNDFDLEEESIYDVLDEPHRYVSENLEKFVVSIDRFFANSALYRYTTDSYIQITGDTLFEESGEIGFDAKFRARVDLPGTKKRFKLIFNTDPSEKQDPLERSVDESPSAAVKESDLYGSLQGKRKIFGWKFRPSVGAKLSIPVDPFVKLRFTNRYPLQRWSLRAGQNFYWFNESGYGSDSNVDIDRPIEEKHLFRTSSFARWTEENNYYQLSQVFAYYHTLSPNRKISYQFGLYSQTHPTLFMTNYQFIVRYRQNLHKNWFFYEIRPQVQYSKENNWDDELSLLFRLEILFGKKYL